MTEDAKLAEAAVVAVDPGMEKCGLAALAADGRVLLKEVLPAQGIVERLRALEAACPRAVLVLGDRTGSRAFRQRLAVAGLARWSNDLQLVDEHLSTLDARRRYLREHPARGWRRRMPASLRVPERPFDDYVAVILAERYLAQRYPGA